MKIKMPANSVILLRNIIGNAGWAVTIDEIYRGGKMLVADIPEVPDGTNPKKNFEFELDTKSLTCCQKAIEFATTKGVVPVSGWLISMIDALGLTPKE